mmetsp:Transcript_13185/g.24347  ORF Transcript_13185/g.24347 Transcript_13185/m.24347 type:complete len:351 (+) Transcript_13185:133-1185(+)
MVDMAVAHPGVERFPTVGDLEEADNAAVSVPTFSEMDVADPGPQGYEPPPTIAGPSAQVAAAATLSVSSSRLAASSLDTDNLANTVDAVDGDENPQPYPTLDYSSLTQSQGEDLDTTMDASKPAAAAAAAAAPPEHVIKDLDTTLDAMKPAPAASALPTAHVVKDLDTTLEVRQSSAAAVPSDAALAKDDLDATVHIPRMKTSAAEGNDELDATVELKLPVPSRDHSPTPAALPKDASPPPTDVRRGYEALKQGLGQGSSEGTRQSQRGASGSSQWGSSHASSSKAIPRSDPFLQRPPRPDKAQGPPQGPPQHGEPLQFCSNRSKDKDSEPGPLTSILQSFFICFSRQSG